MTIKETAGKILLYLYQLQRTVPASMQYRQLGFIDKPDGRIALTSDKKWFTKDLLDINSSSTDIFNAFMFLVDKGFIRSRERTTAGARVYVGIRVTDTGIDIIEGVEHDKDGKKHFSASFNMPVASGDNVEALIRENIDNLLK